MKRTVLLVRSDVNLAGPARLMQAVARSLQLRGFEVVFATGGGRISENIEAEGFLHYTTDGLRIGERGPFSMLKGALQLRRIAHEIKPEVIHSFNVQAGILSWISTFGTRRKIVNTVLGNGKERALPWVPFKLIGVSKSVKEKLLRFGVKDKNVQVVYNSTLQPDEILQDQTAFEDAWANRDLIDSFVFCSIAVFTGAKGQIEIAQSLRAFSKKYPDLAVRILFVGDGPGMAEVQNFLTKHKLLHLAEFVGSTNDVNQYLARSHGFIHLSRQETFGIVLAEAGGQGLGSIAARIGGIPEVVIDGMTGLLVTQNEPDEIAEAMAKFVRDPKLAKKMGWAAAARAKENYTIEQLGENLIQAYERL